MMLKTSGWPERDVYETLRAWYEQKTGVAVPARRAATEGARDAFFQLLASGTLATWTISLGSLLFAAVDRTWPDPVMRSSYSSFAANNLASLLVAFPVFLLVTRSANRNTQQDAEKRTSPVRRWLTYLTLLIAAAVAIGDVIAFLTFLLQGEVTVRFAAKVVVVFLLAGGVFLYYIRPLRGPLPATHDRNFGYVAAAAACIGVALGFWVLGSPSYRRQLSADNRRVQDLRSIAFELHARPGPLPSSLREVRSNRRDPVSGAEYEYNAQAGTGYSLCAVFSATAPEELPHSPFWKHGQGRECFDLDTKQPVP